MQVLVLPENKDINYIKTVQEVKRFLRISRDFG